MDIAITTDAAVSTLRGQVIDLVLGTVFFSIGVTACAIAAIRWRRGVRILVWWGVWSALYGLQTLGQVPLLLEILPHSLQTASSYLNTFVQYLLLVSALLAWRELTVGKLKVLMLVEIWLGLAIALLGVATFLFGGPSNRWMFYNNLLAVVAMLSLLAVVLIPKLASAFLVIPNHRLLIVATLIFAIEALYTNLSTVLQYRVLPLVSPLGFGVLLFSLGYVALEIVFTNERRLLSIETELEMARHIQNSILPAAVPDVKSLGIAISYQPMTAVAGDFYQFIQPDSHHLGILVADVSGHGVPAALIASMIKVAMQSVVALAADPAQVLGGLNRILSTGLPGQLTSAAYLWIDTVASAARYSAAGHPPLLRWRDASGELQRIESNGLLFGVTADAEYPVCSLAIKSGDRFLIYTDGLIEAGDATGGYFGDRRLEEVVRDHRSTPANDLIRQLHFELRRWQPPSANQQDDITLIVVDVL